MTECLLDGEDVRGARVEGRGKGVPESVRMDLLGDAGLGNPLVKAALDLPGGNPLEALADEEGSAVKAHLAPLLQVVMQSSPRFGVKESGDDLTAFGFDGDALLEEINVSDIKIHQLRQSDAGMQKQGYHHNVSRRLPSLLSADRLQQGSDLIRGQEGWRLTIASMNVDADGGIAMDVIRRQQPSEESLDGRAGAIDGCDRLGTTIGLMGYRDGEEEAVEVGGGDNVEQPFTTERGREQSQISLMRPDGVWGSSRRQLMGQELTNRIVEVQFDSSSSPSSTGIQVHSVSLVMNSCTSRPM